MVRCQRQRSRSIQRFLALRELVDGAGTVAFHPHEPILATAGKDGRIRLWRLS